MNNARTYDTLRAKLERFLSPEIGTCGRCLRPWRVPVYRYMGNNAWQQLNRLRFAGFVGVDGHTTNINDHSGCFPLCEGCWKRLSPEERLPYYEALVADWGRQGSEISDEKIVAIREAVLKGS